MRHKFFRTALAAAAVSAAVLSGCVQAPADSAEDTGAAASEASEQTSESVSETETETSAEIESAEESYNEPEYVEVSEENEFIDFEFIEDYQGTTDIGELADKAIEFVKGTEQYADSVKNIDKFSYEAIKEMHTEEKYAKEYADKVAPYINGDNIEPLVSAAYTADYDGDGKSETFIVVDIPYIVWSFPDVWSFLLFADSDGNTDPAVIDFYEGYSASMLNYGKNKHLIFGGWDGMHSYASIYGVKDGKPVTLYDHCPGGYFRKTDCFLSAFGLQGTSAFMYFDTVALEYRNIKGVEMSLEEMTELDVSGSLCSHCNTESLNDLPDYVTFHFIKPNYYLIDWGFPGSHLLTYENGVFTYDEDSNITRSSNYNKLDAVAEFDIDKAVAEMKKPVEPFAQISEGNEFIDYEFIENYQGTTDIGVLAAGAVEFLTESEYYAESAENIGEFTGDEFKKYFDEAGNILPRLKTAYPEDYDGDGSTETFIIVDMPYMIGIPTERSFLIFADSMGNMTLLDHISGVYDTVLLNYGGFKQITFGGSGTAGVEEHTGLYGVKDGKAVSLYSSRVSYHKEDCFLATYGFQGSGDLLYFDTAAQEYCVIGSSDVPIEDIRALDTTNSLSDIFDNYKEGDFLFFSSIGGRYYCVVRGAMDPGDIYLYENGSFTYLEASNVRMSTNLCELREVDDIDMNKAIAEMKSVK